MMNKEKIKEFLKPDLRKVLLLIIIVILSTFITYHGTNCMTFGGGCTTIRGFPFAIYSSHLSGADFKTVTISYNSYFIILNIIFWYLVSCAIIFTYDKFRARK